MIKKRVIVGIFYILLIILISLSIYAPGDSDSQNLGEYITEVSNSDQAEALAQSSGEADFTQDVQFKSNHDSDVEAKSGTHMYSDGQSMTFDSSNTVTEDDNSYTNVQSLVITQNTVSADSAESLESNNVKATGVDGFAQMKNTDAFDAKHLDAVEITTPSGTTTITNVDNLNYLNGNYDFNHADYIKTDDFEAFNINDFSQDAQKFTTESADTLSSDCLELTNIKDAEFIIDETKLFDKSKAIEIKDCLGNYVTYKGTDESTALIVSKDYPYSYSIVKGTLTIPHKIGNKTEYGEILSTLSTAAGIINNFGFTTIELNPTSSYTQKNKDNPLKEFTISIPENADKFLLFIRRLLEEAKPDISFCEQCGYIDFIEKDMILKGRVAFSKRHIKDNGAMKINNEPTAIEPVYEAITPAKAEVLFDDNMATMLKVSLSPLDLLFETFTQPTNWLAFHETIIDNIPHRFLRINNKESDSLISIYSAPEKPDFIHKDITSNDKVYNNEFVMESNNGKGKIIINLNSKRED